MINMKFLNILFLICHCGLVLSLANNISTAGSSPALGANKDNPSTTSDIKVHDDTAITKVVPEAGTSSIKPPSTSSTTNSPPTKPPVPTTTEIPVTPTPQSNLGHWNVTDKTTNVTCIKITAEIEFEFAYTKNKTVNITTLYIPPKANASGSCQLKGSEEKQEIQFAWDENVVKFDFSKDKENFTLSYVAFITPERVPVHNASAKLHGEQTLVVKLNHSYHCEKEKAINISSTVALKLRSFQVQAFKTSAGQTFDEVIDCYTGQVTPDIVPVIVGCVLALLIIAILVAYLISRRRSQARGYLSM